MKKLLLLVLINVAVYSHPGKTDSRGGHNCSAKAKSKGLCTGYHYHNSGSQNSGNTKVTSKTTKNNNTKEIQKLLKNGAYYNGHVDGIVGQETLKAARNYLSDNSYNNERLDYLLKVDGIR